MPRTSRGFARAQRRRRGWETGPGDATFQSTLSASGVALTSGASVLVDGLTIARIRGVLTLQLLTGGVADGFSGAFGIGICTDAAFAIGATAVPTPVTELAWDGWMYWTTFGLRAAGSTVTWAGQNDRIVVDTKAMRKISSDMTVFAAIEVTEIGTASLAWHFDSRLLALLP